MRNCQVERTLTLSDKLSRDSCSEKDDFPDESPVAWKGLRTL